LNIVIPFSKKAISMDQTYAFLSRDLVQLDQETQRLIEFETRRQERKIILIASESICPKAVLEAQASPFSNIYAEGYPSLRMSRREQDQIQNVSRLLAFHRRYGDRRHYKGCDYVNFVESLAQIRAAQLFCPKDPSLKLQPEDLFVNVQPLSGAAANNAVYQALVQPGDVVLGLALPHGGHLTHGSEFNRSGKLYKVIHYEINPQTGKMDYDQIRRQALEQHPKMIIAGASAYPWEIEWKKLRAICDEIGAYLFADIAHPSGLVAAGLFPNPVGYADVTTLTTHKTLCGPRAAIMIATDECLAKKLDSAVFPGEQGGPHINTIAGLAVAFKLAATEEFRQLMQRVIDNAKALAESLQKRGLSLAYGGTSTHLCLVDLNKVQTPANRPLKGDVVSNILDICGITCNKNTIAGDITAADSSAIRLGTTWVSQLGMGVQEMDRLADLIAKVIFNIQSFRVETAGGIQGRGRISAQVLEEVRAGVAELMNSDLHPHYPVYPHYYHSAKGNSRALSHLSKPMSAHVEEWYFAQNHAVLVNTIESGILEIVGERAEEFLGQVATANIRQLQVGQGLRSFLLKHSGELMGDVHVFRMPALADGYPRFWLVTELQTREAIKTWLRDLSDGYVYFDSRCVYTKIDGPVVVSDLWESFPAYLSLTLVGPGATEELEKLYPVLTHTKELQIQEISIDSEKIWATRGTYGQHVYEFYPRMEQLPLVVAKLREIFPGLLDATLAVVSNLREQLKLPKAGVAAKDLVAQFPSYFGMQKPYFIGQLSIQEHLPKSTSKRAHEFKMYDGPARCTCLAEEHQKLSDRGLVPFAGWQMPILYTSILEEHKAVRHTVGLFDVSHMGVLEISGPGATRFLDLVGTNYASKIRPGQSQYSYLIDPNGKVIDDIMIYCKGYDNFMVIVNASNAEKDFAWLKAIASREVIIDNEFPNLEIDVSPVLRDLKEPSAGQDQRVDIALQGPNSLPLLQKIFGGAVSDMLPKMQKATFIEVELQGTPILVSRSGYTGADWGFELYLHPQQAPKVWRMLLEQGKPFGIQPTGLGARDSTRTEAGFPLYGHELAGQWDITPHEAGYGSFVKYHKPFFIGKMPLLKKDEASKNTIVRFEMTDTGIRAIRPGALVVNKKGQMIGMVTSCTFIDERQIGMAYVDNRYAKLGTKWGIFMLPQGRKVQHKDIASLQVGDTFPLPENATVISRFPMRSELAKS